MAESAPAPSVEQSQPQVREVAAAVWQEVLGDGPPADDDNFFDCGGDSVYALSLIATLTEELNLSIPVTTLLRAPTFRAFVETLAELHTRSKVEQARVDGRHLDAAT